MKVMIRIKKNHLSQGKAENGRGVCVCVAVGVGAVSTFRALATFP